MGYKSGTIIGELRIGEEKATDFNWETKWIFFKYVSAAFSKKVGNNIMRIYNKKMLFS